MTKPLDPRLHAYRDDLADIRLKDRIGATHYSDGFVAQCKCDKSDLRRAPNQNAPLDSEILMGEWVRIFELDEHWCWLQSLEDGYVGYAPSGNFVESHPGARRLIMVEAAQSLLFSQPDIKSAPVANVYAGSRLEYFREDDKFLEIYIPGQTHSCFALKAHMRMQSTDGGFLERLPRILYGFLDTPYLWGGRTRAGIDCSGLVQQAFFMAGFPLPQRDSYMQEANLGIAIPKNRETNPLKLGDLVFWPGHVGIMLDEYQLLHANATDMKVNVAPLNAVEAHILNIEGHPIRCIKRIE